MKPVPRPSRTHVPPLLTQYLTRFCFTLKSLSSSISITSLDGNESWDMHKEMLKKSEEFYQMLKHPLVNVVSGASHGAAAKNYDLEAWFPASSTYRELVSCSICTDYQPRKLEIRYGQMKAIVDAASYVPPPPS